MANPTGDVTVQRQSERQRTIDTQRTSQVSAQTIQNAPAPEQTAARRNAAVNGQGAPSNASSSSMRKGRREETVYAITEEEVRDNYSHQRLDAFQENLLFNCKLDSRRAYSAAFTGVMKAITEYAAKPAHATTQHNHGKALRDARKAIAAFLANNASENAEATAIVERYKLYFETFCDGSLTTDVRSAVRKDCTGDNSPALNGETFSAITTYRDAKDEPLFSHEPTINDVQQRMLGDCYLESALVSMVVNDPDKIKECIRDNGDGTCTVRFFQKGYKSVDEIPNDLGIQECIQETDIEKLSDTDLIFKLLVGNSCLPEMETSKAIMDKVKQVVENEMRSITAAIRDTEEYQTASEQEKNQMIRRGVRPVERPFIDMRYDLGLTRLDGVEDVYRLAQHLAQNPVFQATVLQKMRDARDIGGADLEVTLLQGFLALFEIYRDPAQKDLVFDDEAKQLLDSTKKPEAPLVPVYVTVDKSVPSVLGADAYTADALWVQMIEKAYAASGLHPADHDVKQRFKKDIDEKMERLSKKLLEEGLSEAKITERIKEARLQEEEALSHTYAAIEGGQSSEFLLHLTGIPRQDHSVQIATSSSFFVPLWYENAATVVRNALSAEFPELTALFSDIMIGNMTNEIRRKKQRAYPAKDANGNKVTNNYEFESLTIDDFSDCIRDAKSWFFSSLAPELLPAPEILDRFLERYAEALEQALAQQQNSPLQYRRMSGKYMPSAEQEYQAIENALKNKIPVNVGTKKFVPDGVKGSGVNGETKNGGMAENHAYAVVGTKEENGFKFVELRNPWANGELEYIKVTKPDGSVSYRPQEAEPANIFKKLKHMIFGSPTRGTFYMELNDFMSKVDTIYFNSSTPVTA